MRGLKLRPGLCRRRSESFRCPLFSSSPQASPMHCLTLPKNDIHFSQDTRRLHPVPSLPPRQTNPFIVSFCFGIWGTSLLLLLLLRRFHSLRAFFHSWQSNASLTTPLPADVAPESGRPLEACPLGVGLPVIGAIWDLRPLTFVH